VKTTLLKKWLLKTLDVFVQVSRRNLPFPVMGYTHIEADAETGVVRLSCNNAEAFISADIATTVFESGDQMADTQTLHAICQRLLCPQVTLATPSADMLSIQCGNSLLAIGSEVTASEIEPLESFLPPVALPPPSSRQKYDRLHSKNQDEWKASFEIPVAALVRALRESQTLKSFNAGDNDAFSVVAIVHFNENIALMSTGGAYFMLRGLRATRLNASAPNIANTYLTYSLASALLVWARSLADEFLSCEITSQHIRCVAGGTVFRGVLNPDIKDYPKIAPFIKAMSDEQSFDIQYKQWNQFFTITRITRDSDNPMVRVRWGCHRIEQVMAGEGDEIAAEIPLPQACPENNTLTFLGDLMEQGTKACGHSPDGTITVALIRGSTAIAIRSHGPTPSDFGIFVQAVVSVVLAQERPAIAPLAAIA
jgi:hypothetical protein